MRRHYLLLFLMFGCFIGSVLSGPDTSTSSADEEDPKTALHRLLNKDKNYALFLKLLILSPMILAWTASLICIASMCGVCYPFGLSESTKKSDEKKGRKKSTEKKGKKKGGNDE